MFLVAARYYSMNQRRPGLRHVVHLGDEGIGPWTGWIAGWALVFADMLVMASLSQIAGQYTFLLFGEDSLANSMFWVTVVGVIWISS